ncbi:MAG: hypothetical protein JXX28_17270 [Deltaproteobacteria bacterium]|nr:hypothetical protein [Deltaproteobacteria bacterium]
MRCGALLGLTVALGLTGCVADRQVVFPEGLEPLEENLAAWPPVGMDGLAWATGTEGGYDWAHGRGWVDAPIDEVYAALLLPPVDVDRRKVDAWELTDEPGPYAHAYLLHNTVHDVITVEFDVSWRHGAGKGSEERPAAVASRFQKTDGSPVISLLEGSILITEEGPALTSVELVEHLASLSSDTGTIQDYLGDLYADVLATVRGEPLREYD